MGKSGFWTLGTWLYKENQKITQGLIANAYLQVLYIPLQKLFAKVKPRGFKL